MRKATIGSLATVLAFGLAVQAADADAARLTKKQADMLKQEVIPAYQLGDPGILLEQLSQFVAKLDDQRLAAADKVLAEQGIPPVGELLADARLNLVHQNLADKLPAPHPRELLVTLKEFNGRITETLADQDKHAIMSDPLPSVESLDAYDTVFWEVHVLDNRLASASRIAHYAQSLAELGTKRLNQKSLDAQQKELISTDYAAMLRDIRHRRQEMEERKIELRIYRIEDAESILAESQNKRDRFLAVYVLDLDGHLIDEFFKKRAAQANVAFIRQDLQDQSLRDDVQKIVTRGRTSAGDLVQKTQLLYTGLHWWMRGRYGSGPEAFGLLKNRRALTSQQAQFPLYMPMVTPKPTDPAKSSAQVPSVDRRHHYTWAAEYRPISASSSTAIAGSTTERIGPGKLKSRTTTKMKGFY